MIRPSFILFFQTILVQFLIATNDYPIPSDEDLQLLSEELINAYDTVSLGEPLVFKPLAGSVLRLIFHDCGGPPEGNVDGIESQCDGCIELDDFEDHQNLEFRAVDPLEDIYMGSINEWDNKMSRSDFWAFAANEAIRHTRKTANDDAKLPLIPNYFGRNDCSSSPDLDINITNHKIFPSGIFGWEETFNWMNEAFNINSEEIVALLGAHTIGRLHPDDSGFTGPWVGSWGTFNNDYYKEIVEGSFQQRTAMNHPNQFKEWSQGFFFTFLNVDIGLFKDLDDHDQFGAVTCGEQDFDTCPRNIETASIVERFANDPQDWLNIFVEAYIKMSTAGYDIESQLIDQSSI